ncbi:MAG: FecR family protein [Desulfuromonadales bacterium]
MKRLAMIACMQLFIFAGYSACFAQGVVARIQGAVTIDGKNARTADIVKDGAVIETAREAHIDVRIGTGDVVRVKDGKVIFTLAGDKTHLSVVRGKVYLAVKKIFSQNGAYTLDSPNAVAGVRGTRFLFEAAPEGTYICVCEGVVSVSPKIDASIKKSVAKDYDLWVKDGKPVKDPKFSPDMSKMTNQVFEDMGIPAKE